MCCCADWRGRGDVKRCAKVARWLSSPVYGGGGLPERSGGKPEGGSCAHAPSVSLASLVRRLPRKRGRKESCVAFAGLLLLAACSREQPHGWLGYAEGDNAFISAPQPGWLARLNVERGDNVTPGQLLFALDDTHEAAARDQAAAVIPQVRAQLKQARANLDLA